MMYETHPLEENSRKGISNFQLFIIAVIFFSILVAMFSFVQFQNHQTQQQARYNLTHQRPITLTQRSVTKSFSVEYELNIGPSTKNYAEQINAYLNSIQNLNDYNVIQTSSRNGVIVTLVKK